MKKIIFLCLCALLGSCSSEEELINKSTNEKALAEMINDYELVLKGYTLDELKKEKDELTPTKQEESDAEQWLIEELQKASKEKMTANYGKLRSEAKAYSSTLNLVGVFNTGGCRGGREFVYDMDCEDGGDTRITGLAGDTYVDGNGNIRFHFCLVPAGNYGGGTLLLYNYVWVPKEGDVDVVLRHHDNEDHNNKNHIVNDGGLTSTGVSKFDKNTEFCWRFSDKPAQLLGFPHGVLSKYKSTKGSIFIDDENGKNANTAILWTHRTWPSVPPRGITTSRILNKGETFRGITVDRNTIYSIDWYSK